MTATSDDQTGLFRIRHGGDGTLIYEKAEEAHKKMMEELSCDLVKHLSDDEKRNVYHIEKFVRNWKPKQ